MSHRVSPQRTIRRYSFLGRIGDLPDISHPRFHSVDREAQLSCRSFKFLEESLVVVLARFGAHGQTDDFGVLLDEFRDLF